jgi:hypothetical protein
MLDGTIVPRLVDCLNRGYPFAASCGSHNQSQSRLADAAFVLFLANPATLMAFKADNFHIVVLAARETFEPRIQAAISKTLAAHRNPRSTFLSRSFLAIGGR